MTSSANTSTKAVLTSIITNGVICAVFVTLFLLLRLRFKRIYQPKSSFNIVPDSEKPPPLPQDPVTWIFVLLKKPTPFIIQQAGIDGYLFLRYLVIIACIALGGMASWVILLPVNATNGKGETGLDQLGISNVKSVNRYYAHVFISWIFYGTVLFVIYRELHFYLNLRNLVLTTPAYATKLSSRTVVFQTVSDQYLDEEEFFKLFDGVKRVWVARGQRALSHRIKQRDALASKLEVTLTKMLKKAVKIKAKADKKGTPLEPSDQLSTYIPEKKRPKMRLSIFGKKVDVIDYAKEKIATLNEQIEEYQSDYSRSKPMNSITVEFENQYYAQLAAQTTIHDQPFYFSPKYTNVDPGDIIWSNMRIFWWERLLRFNSALVAIIALIVLWAIPVAFVGMISNLTYLTNKMHWLRFIYNLPKDLLGIITSLLPTVMLAILMLLLPIFIRHMAQLAGCVSVQAVEYYTQQAYFAFQVVQVFLVTTISSSFASTVTQIAEQPSKAMELLSSNLPKSSNFYISYMILQGFSISGGALFQIVGFILFYVLGRLFDNTPRKLWTRFNVIGGYQWGTMYPIYSNLAVIFLSYSIISPMIMLFTFAGFSLLYIAFLHNATYVFGKSPDAVGQNYPRAWFQTMVGLYLGEICLLGIFVVSKSWGCVVLEALLLAFTAFVHIHLNKAYDHLLTVVPNTVMRPLDGHSQTLSWKPPHANRTSNGPESFSGSLTKEGISMSELDKEEFKETKITEHLAYHAPLLIEGKDYYAKQRTENKIVQFFKPNSYYTFKRLKAYLPSSFDDFADEDPEWIRHAYDFPDVSSKCPTLWIPRDPMGLSTKEIENLRGVIAVSDQNAHFDAHGLIHWTGAPP
ncbi:hypothetical protein OGAPHI_001210 [Ogataea philodendri]|uniref:DUF221-domain-containing protein n=1 Tax=Ogataea philodendri TaxID=1378263 RepID=A0A9P8PFI7_9ASCO|nr:uncharacterized protein OGAPHI_001210 [Ogataea philodendri]KAH3670695.1 hypothetical protein OGAPHI_001210 [Ogataea philodendri]